MKQLHTQVGLQFLYQLRRGGWRQLERFGGLDEGAGVGDAREDPKCEQLEDCVLYVPAGMFVGHDALDRFAGELRATHPDFVYTPPQTLHNAGRLAWGSGPRGEAPEHTGWDFIIVREGKIAALYVFVDGMPS